MLSLPRRPGQVADTEPSAAARNGDTVAFGTATSPVDAQDEPAASFRNRARLRRRLRYLRQTRELGFRDLGGFMFDSKRLGRERNDIVEAKLEGLAAIDRELRALELALNEAWDVTLLREPGISVCPRCGALHGSEDNYCSSCGLPVGRSLGLAIAQGGPGGAALSPQNPHGAAPTAADAPEGNSAPAPETDAKAARKSSEAPPEGEAAAAPDDSVAPSSEEPSVSKP